MKAHLGVILVCALSFLGAISTAVAQPWPTRQITIVVPFSAGGPTDTLARIMSEPMRRFLGQTIIVDNTTGAGGSIGVGRVVRSAPDGYTLSIGHWGTHVVNGAYYKLTYDLLTDLEPVAMIATNPQMVITRSVVPATNLKELVQWIKTNQGKIQIGTGGIGSSSHIGGLYFLNRVGVKMDFVPYRGGAPAVQALLAGEIDLYMTQISGAIEQVRAGKLRAYMVTTSKRQAAAPEIPTTDEAGSLACIQQCGTASGCPRAPRPTPSSSSTRPSSIRSPTQPCVNVLPIWARKSHRCQSKPSVRSPCITKRRSTSGGRLCGRRGSRRSELRAARV